MANHPSIEYGILFNGCSYEDLTKILPVDEDGFATINETDEDGEQMLVETHPFNPALIFVSFGDLDGPTIPPHKGRLTKVKQLLAKHPKVKAIWGIIRTER